MKGMFQRLEHNTADFTLVESPDTREKITLRELILREGQSPFALITKSNLLFTNPTPMKTDVMFAVS